MDEENITDMTLDRAHRVLALLDEGLPADAIRLALERSTDGHDFGAMMGLLEDLISEGLLKK